MGKKALTTRFDRPLMESIAKELTDGTDLTVSDIHRAAMNLGLCELQHIKEVFDGNFDQTVKSWQDPRNDK